MSSTSTGFSTPDSITDSRTMSDSQTAASNAIGLLDPRLSEQRRRMFELINRLRNTGVQGDISVPVIAVVGAQSAGKSSMIEAISGISLPRKAGTCTRCPTEVHLEYADAPWSCDVSLRRVSASSGEERVRPFGSSITERAQVTERIRRAQRAILNPLRDSNDYLHGPEPTEDDSSFSSDCIVLKISCRDVTDLLFVDLPGLIVGGIDEERILVENLARDYISKDTCIVLVTVMCETDFENQPTYAFARQYDPDGSRIVGVLTKPDRVTSGGEHLWTAHIERKNPRTAGTEWFSVKNPSYEDLKAGITWEASREAEAQYFASAEPWATLNKGPFTGQLGTANLTRKLSDMLYELMLQSLPRIQRELDTALAETQASLGELPPAPSSEPVAEIVRMVTEFTREADRQTQGVPEADGLLQQMSGVEERFQTEIRLTVPNYKPWRSTDQRPPYMPSFDFLLHEEEHIRDGRGPPVYVDEVMRDARSAVTRELPDNYPFVVQKRAILQFVNLWRAPAIRLFESSQARVETLLLRLVSADAHFGYYSKLKQLVSPVVAEHIAMRAQETQERINFLLAMEAEVKTRNVHYFRAYRDKFLALYKGAWRRRTPQARRILGEPSPVRETASPASEASEASVHEGEHIYPSYDYAVPASPPRPAAVRRPTPLERALSALGELGLAHLEAKDLLTLLRSDPEEDALFIMANVRAYFQVAYKRFVDNVPLAIDEAFVRGVVVGLQAAILTNIGIGGREGYETCRRLLQEPEHITRRRDELLVKESRLKEARHEFMRLTL
ncbi:hypothetical protein PENSPDRAFT_753099 [Peniophora sp. CONT]|nr:hypothetical protein PENSPDRAFT_753099 [Peniophora sp. CONT]